MKTRRFFTYILMACLPIGLQAETLTLEECQKLAIENNRTLKNAALDIQMAGEQKKEAYTKYFPNIQANVLAFQTFDEIIKGDGTVPMEIAMINPELAAMAGMPYSYSELSRGYSMSLSVMQPLYAGGQIKTGNKLALLQEDVMKLQLQMKEKDVAQKVCENYWQIASVKYNLSTIEAAEKQIAAVYQHVENCVNAGVITKNDLLKVKIRQQELASNKLKLQNAEHVLLLLLSQQIGRAGETIDIDATAFQPQSPESVRVDVDQAVGSRVEMELVQKGIDAAEMQVKMERGKNLPTVAVGLMGYHSGFGGLSDDVKKYMNTRMTNGLVMGTLSVPISGWWEGKHAMKRQKMKLQQAQNDADDTREQLGIDVEAAWSALQEAYGQIDIARTSVEQSEENLRMSTDQYNHGTCLLTDLLDAETLNRQCHNNLSDAQAKYQVALNNYLQKTR